MLGVVWQSASKATASGRIFVDIGVGDGWSNLGGSNEGPGLLKAVGSFSVRLFSVVKFKIEHDCELAVNGAIDRQTSVCKSESESDHPAFRCTNKVKKSRRRRIL
jgi:hypothetical protein